MTENVTCPENPSGISKQRRSGRILQEIPKESWSEFPVLRFVKYLIAIQ
jgi:hypothetical protein